MLRSDSGLHHFCVVDESGLHQNRRQPVFYQCCELHSRCHPVNGQVIKQSITIQFYKSLLNSSAVKQLIFNRVIRTINYVNRGFNVHFLCVV